MERRTAIQAIFTAVFGWVYSQERLAEAAESDGVTLNHGEFTNATTGEAIAFSPPKTLTVALGSHYESIELKWKGGTVTIPMQELWDALQ